MNYQEIREQFIWNLRLDFDPVGIKFIYDKDLETKIVTHKTKTRITYCQYLAAARQERLALFMPGDRLLCENAQLVFGFREFDKASEVKYHSKYFQDENLAAEAAAQKAKLEKGCKGVYMAPIDFYDKTGFTPDIIFFALTPFQAYHILNDYMAAVKKPNLTFFHTPNSAVCSGSVWAYVNKTANMTTICAGSKTSGKTEMGYVNLFIPGFTIKETALIQKQRVESGQGASLLGDGNVSWPGLDVCKACPLFKFEKIDKD